VNHDITVCLASIPPRAEMLARALKSVAEQTLQPAAIVVEYDHEHTGAAATKNRALAKVTTPRVAFLDDDDWFLPHHLEALSKHMDEADADLVYSVPIIPQNPTYTRTYGHWWRPFDEAILRRESFIQTTVLARTELVRRRGFYCPPGSIYDDWGLCLGVLDHGGKISHLQAETFTWEHWQVNGTATNPGNTSGQAHRWA
jgi:glycosyltransferase involved in cell wall biosynthesis